MVNAPHLTDEQFTRFQLRTLEPAELIAVDRHIATCGDCSDRLWREMGGAGQVAHLRSLFAEHLNYEQIVASIQGSADGAVKRHLAECALCRDEVEDLRSFRSELAEKPRSAGGTVVAMPPRKKISRWPAYAAIAAGLLLAGGLTLRSLRQPALVPGNPPVAKSTPAPAQPAESALTPYQQEAVQLALSTRRLERAEVLDRLIAKRGVLLGAPGEQKSFDLNAPLGTTVFSEKPAFRWGTVSGASSYVVAVFDDRFQKVAESPALTTTEWTPEAPLARGRIYNWQVTAHRNGGSLRSPVPPAPEARFQVADAQAVAEMEAARREHPGNHLLLAVLLAKAGALDEAGEELDALAQTDAATAQSLRDSLKELRKR